MIKPALCKGLIGYLDKIPNNQIINSLFLRGLGFIYCFAFVSMSTQIVGLIGSHGILPLNSELIVFDHYYESLRYWALPTVFWLDASDQTLVLVCWIGALTSILLLLGLMQRLAIILCYLLYLSITVVGQEFTNYQWDALLLESGFLAIFLSWGSVVIIFLFRFLIARFMLLAGIVKIASGDTSWLNFSALQYYFQTQPLPSPLAYYAHQLPDWFGYFCVAYVLLVEVVLPFFVFCSAAARQNSRVVPRSDRAGRFHVRAEGAE
jgi:hypothetical protein